LVALCALGAACSSTNERSAPSYRAPDGGSHGGNGGDVGNPDQDGGAIMVGEGGVACPPDSEDCQQPPAKDGGELPPNDGSVPPIGKDDAAMPEPDADVPLEDAALDAGDEPDGDVIIPEDGGTLPTTYKIDLLFVVDNSGSMTEEQALLQQQFPQLIQRLLGSTAIGGGGEVLAGAQDVHLGVVSTDLGAPGVLDIAGCTGLGDNGLLNNVASTAVTGCSASLYEPRFLSYVAGSDDPAQLATDLACISALGIDGCGFEQQLESMLKAVWPGSDGRITFLPDLGLGGTGQAGATFPNGDFVRHDEDDVSVLAVVLVTDEEDCSSNNTTHLMPGHQLPMDDPRRLQGLNLRCYYASQEPEPNALFDIERYVIGLQALRPGYGQRVVFGAIVGVPPELVSESAIASVDFSDDAERSAHYQAILNHPDMQYRIDDRGTPDLPDDDNLMTSCTSPGTRAYAPRRIVEVARGFGERGFVQSICTDDWSPAMELLATRIAQARSE
jgi:hypothetical protein